MKNPLLGGLTPQQFLRDYWQKKLLPVRRAVPGFKDLLDPQLPQAVIALLYEWYQDSYPAPTITKGRRLL